MPLCAQTVDLTPLRMRLLMLVLTTLVFGAEQTLSRDSNFQIILGDVELGPLSQRPELFKVAALQNVLVNVTDDQQTAVVTVGVNIRLDWSSWVSEVLDGSAGNATYTYQRTQLNESGSAIGSSEMLRQTEYIAVKADESLNVFFVEITSVVVAAENESDRAIYELDACVPQPDGSVRCYGSNITVYAIKRPEPLLVFCGGSAVHGRVSKDCMLFSNSIIVIRTCTVEAIDIGQLVPCNGTGVTFSVRHYPPGNYSVTFNFTDIYGQTVHEFFRVDLSEPLLNGHCDFVVDGLNVYCQSSVDNTMVMVTYFCAYDGGPPEPCGRNITIERARFSPGPHILTVTFITGGGQTSTTQLLFVGFELDCTVDGDRTLVVRCEGVSGVINDSQVVCIYDDGPMRKNLMCELPVTIDFARYDSNSGYHNITIVATSTLGETDDYNYTFFVQDIECVQLTEPGRITVICQSRVKFDREIQPLCLFDDLSLNIPCEDISNIVIVPSEMPLISGLTGESVFLISAFDLVGNRVQTTLQLQLTQEQLVECSTTLNCSSNSTLMSARECCVSSVDGLSYSIQGQEQCHTCIVFGWFQDSFTGIEQGPVHMIHAGYLKGGDPAGVEIILDVVSRLDSASTADFTIETETVRLSPTAAVADPNSTVAIVFLVDEVPEEGEEWLTLELDPPTPSTLLTLPAGEGVFFRNFISLAIKDSDVAAVGRSNTAVIIGSIVGVAAFLLMVGVSVIVICCYGRHSFCVKKDRIEQSANEEDSHHVRFSESSFVDSPAESERAMAMTVQSSYKLDIPLHLIIPSSNIKLTETIGQGEFGIVYKGHMVKHRGSEQYLNEYLAIKTLKGFYDRATVRDMLKECSEMSNFHHPNILTLKGVCLDGGPAPYIIMPFMANGSLLAYQRKNRNSLVISCENVDVESVYKQLMDMCIQVAKGMEYLARMNVVHRDLAARNCMIDTNFVIKVADFGLSERTGIKDYFRLDKATTVKLPLKWLPPESIDDYIFSEKSDVWAYGVTCWEVFTGGRVPYVDLAPADIPKQLASGYRLGKPQNEACSNRMYDVMLQCWSLDPSERPSFSHLVEFLSQTLEGSSGYMDIGDFGTTSECTMTESEANVIQETSRKELSPGES